MIMKISNSKSITPELPLTCTSWNTFGTGISFSPIVSPHQISHPSHFFSYACDISHLNTLYMQYIKGPKINQSSTNTLVKIKYEPFISYSVKTVP